MTRTQLILVEHVLVMAKDSYLVGHPEWGEIVKDARRVILEAIEQAQAIQQANPPASWAWQDASEVINRLAIYMQEAR